MDKRGDPESSWRVLFEITLSHGEWIRLQRIAYKGFLTFLRSANLLNFQNGVSLLLVEQLWWKHRVVVPPPVAPIPNLSMSFSSTKPFTQEDYFKNREEVYSHGLLNFEGFTDIMNLISVRCYQTRKCAYLHKEVGGSLKDAIILSSEDNVNLKECVAYTAKRCLKSFIYRNLVHRNTKMLLDPMRNEWTIQTNRVVCHIVNNLQDTVIVPLFEYYSDNSGEMNCTQFERFVKGVFPDFTVVQKSSALSIFHFDVARKERYGCVENLDANDGTAPLVFGLDSFVDALLMLSVVAFADESRFPHHLSITSKVWSIFESYLCPAVQKLGVSHRLQNANAFNMAADPFFLDSVALAVPYISSVFPRLIPVDDLSSILVSGINIMIDPAYIVPEGPQHGEAKTLSKEIGKDVQSDKPIFRRVGQLLKPPPVHVLSVEKGETLSSPEDEMQDKMEMAAGGSLHASNSPLQLPEVDSFTARGGSVLNGMKASSKTSRIEKEGSQKSTNSKCMDNITEGHSSNSFPTVSLKSASKLYSLYIDDEACLCMRYARNRMEVILPESVRNIRLFKLAVMYKKEGEKDEGSRKKNATASGQNRCGYFQITPIRQMSFSLRDSTGGRIFTTKTVVLKATSACRPVPSPVLHILQEAFSKRAKPEDIVSDMSLGGEPYITMSEFENICCFLCMTPDEALAAEQCQTALRESVHTSLLLPYRRMDASDKDLMEHIKQDAWGKVRLNFSQFMEAVAALGLRMRSSMLSDSASDLINFLLFVLPIPSSIRGESKTSPTQADSTLASEFVLPSIETRTKGSGLTVSSYSSRLNGPCKKVLHHCRHPSFASRLDEYHQALNRPPKVLLPGYPSDALGKEACPVSCRLSPEFNSAFEILKNEFLMHEVSITTDGSGHLF